MTQLAQPNKQDEYGYPTRPDARRRLRNFVVHSSKRLLLATTYGAMSIVGTWLRSRQAGRHLQPLDPQHFHPRRILIIRMDLIGDLTLSLTVVRALKRTYPDAEIDLLAIPASAPIVTADPDLTEIITYNPNIWRRPQALLQRKNWQEAKALRRRLQARHYDIAISVFGPWAAILAVLSGAPRRLGFGKESYPGFMTDNVPGRHWDEHDHKHEVDYCLELARAAGASIKPEDRVPQLFVNPQVSLQVEQMLQQEGWRTDKPLIACHVSSNNGQSKRWPIPYWATLLDRLIREQHAQIILTGAPSDLPLIAEITGRMHEQPINLAGRTSLPQLAALLQRVDLMI